MKASVEVLNNGLVKLPSFTLRRATVKLAENLLKGLTLQVPALLDKPALRSRIDEFWSDRKCALIEFQGNTYLRNLFVAPVFHGLKRHEPVLKLLKATDKDATRELTLTLNFPLKRAAILDVSNWSLESGNSILKTARPSLIYDDSPWNKDA